jgi:hypothetical protein
MKTENVGYFQIEIHTNKRERDETNAANDDVFRSVCSDRYSWFAQICMTHGP